MLKIQGQCAFKESGVRSLPPLHILQFSLAENFPSVRTGFSKIASLFSPSQSCLIIAAHCFARLNCLFAQMSCRAAPFQRKAYRPCQQSHPGLTPGAAAVPLFSAAPRLPRAGCPWKAALEAGFAVGIWLGYWELRAWCQQGLRLERARLVPLRGTDKTAAQCLLWRAQFVHLGEC